MTNVFANLNWIGIGLAFLAYFLLGAIWFTTLFSKSYRKSLGREHEKQQPPALIYVLGPAVCSLVITIATAVLMHAMNIQSYPGAFELAAIVGIGYLVANTVNIAINPNIPRPLFYGMISGAYHLTGVVLVCVILVAMK